MEEGTAEEQVTVALLGLWLSSSADRRLAGDGAQGRKTGGGAEQDGQSDGSSMCSEEESDGEEGDDGDSEVVVRWCIHVGSS